MALSEQEKNLRNNKMKNITSKTTHNLIILIMLLAFNASSFGQALHWLSKPNSQLGPVVNGSMNSGKMSANGRYIIFVSNATNHVDAITTEAFGRNVFVYDRVLDKVSWVNEPVNSSDRFDLVGFSAPTSDGTLVAFISTPRIGFGDKELLYTKNLITGEVKLISEADNGVSFEVGRAGLSLLDDGSAIDFTTDTQLLPEHATANNNMYRFDLINETFSLVSISDDEAVAANAEINNPTTSPSGRYVAFSTDANNLTNDVVTGNHVYLRDTQNQTTRLVTVQPGGDPSNVDGFTVQRDLSVSNTGHLIYNSSRDDLVTNDDNERTDLFLYHMGTHNRISFDNGSGLDYLAPSPAIINATGNRITFLSFGDILPNETNPFADNYQYNIDTDEFTLIETNFDSLQFELAASADGQSVLVAGDYDEPNENTSISNLFFSSFFIYNTNTEALERIEPVAFNPDTTIASVFRLSMSENQRYAIFGSQSPNLLPVVEQDQDIDSVLFDRETQTAVPLGNRAIAIDISSNGRYVLLASRFFQPAGLVDLMDINLFVHDRTLDSYTQVSSFRDAVVNDSGLVAFWTFEQLLPTDQNDESDVYLFDTSDASLHLISKTPDGLAAGANNININNDPGAVSVVFSSFSSDLVAGDVNGLQDVFVADWPSGDISRISQTTALAGGDGPSILSDISDDGQTIVFTSEADNLTNDVTNGINIYIHDRTSQMNELAGVDDTGNPLDIFPATVNDLDLSQTGDYIGFQTAESLVFLGEDPNLNDADVFLINRNNNQIKLISQPLNGDGLTVSASGINVYEDLSVSPPRLGVSFLASGRLTGHPNHPNYNQAFLYQEGGPNLNLNIAVTGTGSVGGSLGISCMTDCDFDFPLGTELSLVATPSGGFVFDRWNSSRGQCIDDVNPCLLTMDQAKQIQAIFIDPADIIFEDGFE